MINLRQMHQTLEAMGFPVEEVRRESDVSVKVEFQRKATQAQRERAQAMVNTFVDSNQEDFAAFAQGYTTALEALPTVEDLDGAKKMDDLRAMALALRAYIDQYVH